jgi:hypothetical protein
MSNPEILARHGAMNGVMDRSSRPVDDGRDPLRPSADPYLALKSAEHALDLARAEARECRAATLQSRTTFSKALENWNASGPVWTQEMQARAFIATSNADRARRAALGQLPYHPGITRTAKAIGGGGHNVKQGGGNSYRRGAYTRAQAMEIEANRLRTAAAAAKPPQR